MNNRNAFWYQIQIRFFFFNFCKTHVFLFLNKTHKRKQTNTHILAYFTHNKCIFVQYWRIIDLNGKPLNTIPYTSSDKIFKITLKFDLDLTMFVQVFEVSTQFYYNTVHIVTALIGHIWYQRYLSPILLYIFFLANKITVSIMEFLQAVPNTFFWIWNFDIIS